MGLDRYQELAAKYLNKTISPAEEEEFSLWYNSNQDEQLFIPDSFAKNEKVLWARILLKIKRKSGFKKTNIFPIYIRYAAAAIVLFIIGTGTYYYLKTDKLKTVPAKPQVVKNDVLPGGNKAILTLADGSKIILNTVKKGVLTNQGTTVLNKLKENILVYQASKTSNLSPSAKVGYNTITTPKGGQFQVTLPDGSKIWLNAASSIQFPTIFLGKERKVTITGEVYFEVTKNKLMPFKVLSGKQVIEVLGTHFNINAYTDESQTKTTLVEGSIKIYCGSQTALLKPGQQAIISNIGYNEISIKETDADDVLAWKNGIFVFESADIAQIMRQAARWYDVRVDYEGKLPEKKFTGSISRNVNLSELLNMLKYTGVNFKIQGKTIIVTS